MSKLLIVTMQIEVDDLPDDERAEEASLSLSHIDDLPTLEEADEWEVAGCVSDAIDTSEEIFSGSDMFVRIIETKVLNAEWAEV